ncbi:MAG: hypothetical protein AAGD14_12375 [Planctomycetota bacterium]
MKRLLLVFTLLAGFALLLYGLGRPPSSYVLETVARERQQRRREDFIHFSQELAKVLDNEAESRRLRALLDARMLASMETQLGGWQVVFLPRGARVPKERDSWLAWGELEPALRTDPGDLLGKWRVWMRPVTLPAKVVAGLGGAPPSAR